MRIPVHIFSAHAAPLERLVRSQQTAPRSAHERELIPLSELAALADVLPEVQVLFAPRPPKVSYAAAARLRLIQSCGVGADHFLPLPDLPDSVEIAGMRGAMADDVAEHVLAMWLALTRELPRFIASQQARKLVQRPVPRLRGARLAIVGFGAIGRAIAARDSPFYGIEGLIMTPHVAGYGTDYLERAVQRLLENVDRLERAAPREGLIDRDLGY